MATQAVKRRIPGPAVGAITELALTHRDWTPGQIYQELINAGPGDVSSVSKRTVERIVKDLRYEDESGPWDMDSVPVDDAWRVLEVLRAELESTPPTFFQTFTKSEAKRVAWVHRLASRLSLQDISLVALIYLAAQENGWDKAPLDAFLAFQPWSSPDALNRWEAVSSRWRQAPPMPLLNRLTADFQFQES